MNVVTTLKMDLSQPEQPQQVFCVQGDTFSRTVVLELLSGGQAWQIPENTSVLISYHKPDGTCGAYTQMPDGTQAWEISENVITLGLTPQMLTTAGIVIAQLKLICLEQTISTFTIQIIVRPGIAPGDDAEAYTSWLAAYLPQTSGADLGQYLQVSQVDESGRVTEVTAADIVIPPDLTDSIRNLESRTLDLENSTSAIPGLGSRVTALERSTGELQTIKSRIETLENHVVELPQLKSRVEGLENNMENLTQLETRVDTLEQEAEALRQLDSRIAGLENNAESLIPRIDALEQDTEALQQLQSRVTALESGAASYPSEWESDLNDCIAAINSHLDYGGAASVGFAYFSDNHHNGGCAGALISHVMEECGLPFSFYCGDIVSQEPIDSLETVDAQVSAFNAMMSPIPKGQDFRAVGEHDICRTDSNGSVLVMNVNQIYHRFFRKQHCTGQCVVGEGGSYFYLDDSVHKIRFIVLNSQYFTPKYNTDQSLANPDNYGFGQDQIDWLVEEALIFPSDGWSVVFISHSPLSNQNDCNLRDASLIKGILTAFIENGTYSSRITGWDGVRVNVDFQDAITADLIGWFSGHTHMDSITALELANDPELYSSPLQVVTIAADGENGNIVDFVTIDKELRTVFLTRLGDGESRSFTY